MTTFGNVSNENYITNNIDETLSTTTYIGKEDREGHWLIQKIDETSGTVFTFASMKNNPDTYAYSNAWSQFATLSYGTYNEAI